MLAKMMSATAAQGAALGLLFFDRLVLSSILLHAWNLDIFEDWSLLFAGAGLLNLTDFGLQLTFGNAFTRHFQSGNVALFTRQMEIGLAIMASIFLLGLLGLTLAITTDAWHGTIVTRHMHQSDAAAVFMMLGTATLVQTASGITNPIYRAQDHLTRGLLIELATGAARLGSMAFVVLAGGGVIAAAAAYLIATVSAYLLTLRDQFQTLSALTAKPRLPSRKELLEIASSAVWFYAQHASTVVLLGAPLLMLGYTRAEAGSIAAFVMLRTLSNLSRQLSQTLANTTAIELSRSWFRSQDLQPMQSLVLRATRLIAVAAGATSGALLPLASAICQIWSGGRVASQFDVATVFCVGIAVTAPATLVATYLNYIGVARIGAYSKLLNLIVATLSAVVLVKPFGLVGIASALMLGEVIGLGLLYLPEAEHWTGINRYALAGCWIGWTALGAAPVFAVAMAIIAGMQEPQSLALAALTLPVLAAAAVLLFGLTSPDRSRLLLSAKRRVLSWTNS